MSTGSSTSLDESTRAVKKSATDALTKLKTDLQVWRDGALADATNGSGAVETLVTKNDFTRLYIQSKGTILNSITEYAQNCGVLLNNAMREADNLRGELELTKEQLDLLECDVQVLTHCNSPAVSQPHSVKREAPVEGNTEAQEELRKKMEKLEQELRLKTTEAQEHRRNLDKAQAQIATLSTRLQTETQGLKDQAAKAQQEVQKAQEEAAVWKKKAQNATQELSAAQTRTKDLETQLAGANASATATSSPGAGTDGQKAMNHRLIEKIKELNLSNQDLTAKLEASQQQIDEQELLLADYQDTAEKQRGATAHTEDFAKKLGAESRVARKKEFTALSSVLAAVTESAQEFLDAVVEVADVSDQWDFEHPVEWFTYWFENRVIPQSSDYLTAEQGTNHSGDFMGDFGAFDNFNGGDDNAMGDGEQPPAQGSAPLEKMPTVKREPDEEQDNLEMGAPLRRKSPNQVQEEEEKRKTEKNAADAAAADKKRVKEAELRKQRQDAETAAAEKLAAQKKAEQEQQAAAEKLAAEQKKKPSAPVQDDDMVKKNKKNASPEDFYNQIVLIDAMNQKITMIDPAWALSHICPHHAVAWDDLPSAIAHFTGAQHQDVVSGSIELPECCLGGVTTREHITALNKDIFWPKACEEFVDIYGCKLTYQLPKGEACDIDGAPLAKTKGKEAPTPTNLPFGPDLFAKYTATRIQAQKYTDKNAHYDMDPENMDTSELYGTGKRALTCGICDMEIDEARESKRRHGNTHGRFIQAVASGYLNFRPQRGAPVKQFLLFLLESLDVVEDHIPNTCLECKVTCKNEADFKTHVELYHPDNAGEFTTFRELNTTMVTQELADNMNDFIAFYETWGNFYQDPGDGTDDVGQGGGGGDDDGFDYAAFQSGSDPDGSDDDDGDDDDDDSEDDEDFGRKRRGTKKSSKNHKKNDDWMASESDESPDSDEESDYDQKKKKKKAPKKQPAPKKAAASRKKKSPPTDDEEEAPKPKPRRGKKKSQDDDDEEEEEEEKPKRTRAKPAAAVAAAAPIANKKPAAKRKLDAVYDDGDADDDETTLRQNKKAKSKFEDDDDGDAAQLGFAQAVIPTKPVRAKKAEPAAAPAASTAKKGSLLARKAAAAPAAAPPAQGDEYDDDDHWG